MKYLIAIAAILAMVGCKKGEPTPSTTAESAQTARVCISDETDKQPRNYNEVRDLAMKGNYQAQRNLAFGYVGGMPYKKQDENPILGCAWYKYITISGNEKVNSTDIANVQVYCGRLSAQEQASADAQMQSLVSKLCH